MTHNSARSEVRLFFDGRNKVVYKVSDSNGFDFSNVSPIVVGWDRVEADPGPEVLPLIEEGASQLQKLVDAFNGLGLKALDPDELVHLVVDPRQLFEDKVEEQAKRLGAEGPSFREAMAEVDWDPIAALEAELMDNPYTVHQVLYFMETAPLTKVYALRDGEVVIQREGAREYGEMERLRAPDFDMDDLALWNRVLSPAEVADSYAERMDAAPTDPEETVSSLTAASWNIWHGGKHQTMEEHGSDSRLTIAEILKEEAADVVMMQETYSSGDFIAAELGYYFATTVDWDYLNQGSNISVLSRFPIKEIHVQEDSPFMNVGVKVAVSGTQDMYVMSNWYGMDQFPAVFDFHQQRFSESDSIPTLFAGDFNAVPHTDGGDSPASRALLDAGFTDAFRSLYPDAEAYPGPTHRNGRRIDQLYYKGTGLENTSTKLVSTWPTGFPSDHLLILSAFELGSVTR
jgi:exonuclease III